MKKDFIISNNILAVQNLENCFQKKPHDILKTFLSDTPQSIKRQNKGPKAQEG